MNDISSNDFVRIRVQAKLKEAVPLNNVDLVQKIHQTYRIQYIQNIILPAPVVFEENVFSTLTSFVFFNKMEIVTMIKVSVCDDCIIEERVPELDNEF